MTSHIFLLDTELQCYASLKIVEIEDIKAPVFFSFNPNINRYLRDKGFNSTYLEKKCSGLFRQTRALHRSIAQLEKHLSDKNIIYLHRLDLIYTNVLVGTLLKKHDIEVNIVPEGMLNFALEDVSVKWLRRSKRWKNRISYGLTGLKKLELEGERVGVNMPVVTRAYSFAGLESPYPKEKVKYVSFFAESDSQKPKHAKRALVVGQSILNNQNTPKEVEQRISDNIQNQLDELGISDIDYVPHPRDKNICLKRDNYRSVSHPFICLEQYLELEEYDVLISCCSTVLLTAKLIFGDKIDAVAVGLNTFPTLPQNIASIATAFDRANVRMLDL